ncbi:hypothetical protein Tco_1455559 [Tanacetum coccineum]
MSNSNTNLQTQTSSVLQNVTVSSCSNSNIQEKTQLSRSRCMHSLKEIKSLFKFLSETLQDYGTMPIFKRTFSQDLDLLENHLTKEIISQTDCKTTLTKLRTTFENAFNSEFKARMQKYTRFDAQSFYDAMLFNMDSIGKYMLEITLHQQRTPQLLKQKKLMQTQEDHSNPIPALNVDSLKVDLVVIQNTYFEKEDNNSETASSKSVKESSLNSETKDVHAIKYKMSKSKERCMANFRSLHSHLQVLSKEDLKGTRIEHGFKRAFMSLFGQDVDTFTSTMLLNVDQLQKQLDKDGFQEDGSMSAFWVVNNQFQKFIDSQFTLDYDSQMAEKYFVEYTGIEVKHFRDILLQHMGNVKKSIAERTLDADLVVTKSSRTKSEVQDESSKSGNDTDADDADIRPIYDEEPMAESGNDTDADDADIRPIYDEEPMAKYPEKCQVKSHMIDLSLDNQTSEYSKQSIESENILLKKTVAQFQKYFSRMETHYIALELKYQNQALKLGQHGQILNATSNKAKIKKEIEAFETINIELEHSVAKLLTKNEHLNKENETLKRHYKDLYDSIKITRSKTIEQATSLLANNADLKAQIQEKVFAIAALKNDLRKLKGNSVDAKFAKTSVLGKPVLQSLRNQSVVRQPNAFKSKRPQMSKPRFASQVDVNNNLSRPNMPRFSSNDMVHNHYLDEARKKTPERDRNSKTSMMPYARFQSTADGSKPKPRSNNQTPRSLPVSKSSCVTIMVVPKADHSKRSSSFSDSKQFVCYTCHKCVFNANHDACITKLLKEVNSRAKILSYKTKNRNKPIDQKSHTQKPGRQIFTGHRWIPTGKFDSCTSKVDSETPHGSNVDIPNIHECKQTLDVSVEVPTSNMIIMTLMPELESLFGPLFDEYFNGENQVVSKSSAVTTADASDKRQQQPDSTSSTSTLATTVTADGNFDL